jgi:hypothetical protein
MLIGTSIDIFQNSHLQYYHILYVNVTVLPFISVLLFSLFLELSFHVPSRCHWQSSFHVPFVFLFFILRVDFVDIPDSDLKVKQFRIFLLV